MFPCIATYAISLLPLCTRLLPNCISKSHSAQSAHGYEQQLADKPSSGQHSSTVGPRPKWSMPGDCQSSTFETFDHCSHETTRHCSQASKSWGLKAMMSELTALLGKTLKSLWLTRERARAHPCHAHTPLTRTPMHPHPRTHATTPTRI